MKPLTQKKFFELRFGRDFSGVRIHSGPEARQLAIGFGAKGFAVGDDIFLASGEFPPRGRGAIRLLAHELAHVVQHQRNVISLSWDDSTGPERTQFRDLERSLREHGFGFTEEGEHFNVSIPPSVAPSLGIHDLVPHPQRIHRSATLSAMSDWLALAIQLEQRSSLARGVRGPRIVDVLTAAFAHWLLPSSRGPLWVMRAGDTYTSRVRLWTPVTEQLTLVKQHLEGHCEEWMSEHRTSPDWTPSATYPPNADTHSWNDPSQGNPEAGRWAINPPGTGPQINADAYAEYFVSGNIPDVLWTSAIGSFGLYVTVDSINCESGSAILNVWMYNNMDQQSFGNPTWFSSDWSVRHLGALAAIHWSGGVDAQYIWWNWTEPRHWAPR